jgi:hypothetical protein
MMNEEWVPNGKVAEFLAITDEDIQNEIDRPVFIARWAKAEGVWQVAVNPADCPIQPRNGDRAIAYNREGVPTNVTLLANRWTTSRGDHVFEFIRGHANPEYVIQWRRLQELEGFLCHMVWTSAAKADDGAA